MSFFSLMHCPTSTCADSQFITSSIYIAGPEFGNRVPGFSNKNPGSHGEDFYFNSEDTFAYFASKGFTVFRIPLMWERLQPELHGPLDSSYVSLILRNISWAKKHGGSVILDIMNQCRYSLDSDGRVVKASIDETIGGKSLLTSSDLVDLWKRISSAFKSEAGVFGYGLMNEPHDLNTGVWKRVSQSLVDSIRRNGDAKMIFINGDGWSCADNWEKHNPYPWISDPEGNFVYEASCFLDGNGTGTYSLSFDDELIKDPALCTRAYDRASPFFAWCKKHGVRGYISATGVPNNEQRWLEIAESLFEYTRVQRFGWAYWAGGEWWKSYPLSIQPLEGYAKDAPQLSILEKYIVPCKK